MRSNLPTDLLRSFLAIVDTGSMVRAAEKVHLTQSAISLQIRRLEKILNTILFSREGRRLELTPCGTELSGIARKILELNDQAVALLSHAQTRKRIRIGLVQDFADSILKAIFMDIYRGNLELMTDVKVGTSFELLSLFDGKELDLVMFMEQNEIGEFISSTPIRWYGESHLPDRATLPIAVLDRPCSIRKIMFEALEQANRPYRVVVETRSISALRAAVTSGIAVTARGGAFMPAPLIITHPALPPLPQTSYRLLFDLTIAEEAPAVLDQIRKAMAALSHGSFG